MNAKTLKEFVGRQVRGGFTIVFLEMSTSRLIDALGREAIARTHIVRRQFSITIRAGLSDKELSVSIYHEILEAATVASIDPPKAVRSFNEGDFERAAYQAHEKFGEVSPKNVDRMLQFSTGSDDNDYVANRADIQIELVKLPGGERLLRLAEPLSGLALERKLDAKRSVHDQKRQLLDVFAAALKRAQLTAA